MVAGLRRKGHPAVGLGRRRPACLPPGTHRASGYWGKSDSEDGTWI